MSYKSNSSYKEVGRVESLYSGIATVSGLPGVKLREVLLNEKGEKAALVMGFDAEFAHVLLFDQSYEMGERLYRTHNPYQIHLSDDYMGRVVNGFGEVIDNQGDIGGKLGEVFKSSPLVTLRDKVTRPLQTGIKVIDTTLPIGRGQRCLIVGDRKLGKTVIALSAILAQRRVDKPVFCVYVAIGQKIRQTEQVVQMLQSHEALDYTAVVTAPASSAYAQQYLAPFVGLSIGEFLRDQGKDVLIVYDDLSSHAKTYRDISLLLNRAPGREAYPGDIFSLHAGLLERAGQLNKRLGGGSITALPIVQTLEGDITAYVPTNIISITDGQIYMDQKLFHKQHLPAVNVDYSVSRIGGQAQPQLLRDVTKGLRLALAQHRQLLTLTQLETTISLETRKQIHRGELILALLRQERLQVIPWEKQAVLFYAVENGFFDDLKEDQWKHFEHLLLDLLETKYHNDMEKIRKGTTKTISAFVHRAIEDFKKEFLE